MKILVDIGHPADVHLFKNFIWKMEKKGYEVLITARKKDVTLGLLDKYEFDYITVGGMKGGKFNLMKEWILRDVKILKIALDFNPGILIGVHNPTIAHVAKILRKKSIIFTETELGALANLVTFSFATVICTPSCFRKDLGRKQVRYNTYHQLAYLHPNYFKPNPSVLYDLGLKRGDKFVILRFVAWQALHDIGQHGFDLQAKKKLVKEFEKYARVFITSEKTLPKEFEKYRIAVSPHRFHDLLHYAALFVGEGGAMTAEAGVMGIPAIRHTSFAGPNDLGYLQELERKYDLVYSFREFEQVLVKAREILERQNSRQEWAKKREKLLKDSIDLTAFMTWFIEDYPESFETMKRTPDYQDKFKFGEEVL